MTNKIPVFKNVKRYVKSGIKEMRWGGADRQQRWRGHRTTEMMGRWVGWKRRSCRGAGPPDHRHDGETGGTDRQTAEVRGTCGPWKTKAVC